MDHKSFAVFIMTHGRPDKVYTLKTLRERGYTGKIYIVIDDEDSTADEYRRLYGDDVIQFNKREVAQKVDAMDMFDNRKVVLFARNVCFDIAEMLGLEYFLECDDDYTSFTYRRRDGEVLRSISHRRLDDVFDAMLDFLDVSGAKTVAFAQAGDYIGGKNSKVWKEKLTRKAMNAFFCRTDNRIDFIGRINEDVNTYTTGGNRGDLYFTVADMMLTQLITQSNAGGMTDVYKEFGTYTKSFYSIICSPQAVKIGVMGNKDMRLHHHIDWNRCCPKILSEEWKK